MFCEPLPLGCPLGWLLKPHRQMAQPLGRLLALLLAWRSRGPDAADAAAALAGQAPPSLRIPTEVELRKNCPVEYKACVGSAPCGQAIHDPREMEVLLLDEIDSMPRAQSPRALARVLQRFDPLFPAQQRWADKRDAQIRHQDTVRRVATEIACDACQLLVEDMWTLLMRCGGSPISANDGSCAHGPPGGNPQGVEAGARKMMSYMCGNVHPYKSVVGWLDNYFIHNCSKPDTAACTKSERSDGHLIERDGTGTGRNKQDEKEAGGHAGVYSTLCRDYIAPHDIDIIEAFGGEFAGFYFENRLKRPLLKYCFLLKGRPFQ